MPVLLTLGKDRSDQVTGKTDLPQQKFGSKKDSGSLGLFVHLPLGLHFKIWSFDLFYFIRFSQAFDYGLAVVIRGQTVDQRSCCFLSLTFFWGFRYHFNLPYSARTICSVYSYCKMCFKLSKRHALDLVKSISFNKCACIYSVTKQNCLNCLSLITQSLSRTSLIKCKSLCPETKSANSAWTGQSCFYQLILLTMNSFVFMKETSA